MKTKLKLNTAKQQNTESKIIRGETLSCRPTVELWHSQTIKQSANYQSADCTCGIKLTVDDNEKSIKQGFARAERLVEEQMSPKIQEQIQVLNELGKNR